MFSKIRKAVMAFVGAFVAGLLSAAAQRGGYPGWPEVGVALGLGFVAALAVWKVPNAGPRPPEGVTGRYAGNL
jgi:hypothetical protein